MPSELELELQQDVLEAILEFEVTADFEVQGPASINVIDGTVDDAPTLYSDIPCSPVCEYEESMEVAQHLVGTSYIMVPSKDLPEGFNPENFQKVTVGGRQWTVSETITHSAGTLPTAYEVRLMP